MIKHIVMLQLIDGFDAGELADIMDGLASLPMDRFCHGPNRDVERKTPDYPYGFICDFSDLSALGSYAKHPVHQALGARLCALCLGGADGIMVMDLDV